MTTASLFPPTDLVAGNLKAAMKLVGASSAEVWNVKPQDIHIIDGFNGRVDTPEYRAHVESIAESIMANGFYRDKPLAGFVANKDGVPTIYVTDGHTRLAAALIAIARGAQLETLPVVTKPRGTTMEDLTVALITSNSGKSFTPYETGMICKRLIDFGMTEKVIAQRLSLTMAYVIDLLALVAAPKAIRDMVTNGQVSATAAIKEITTHGSKAVARLTDGLDRAKKAGKTKVTGKHLGCAEKATVLRLNATVLVAKGDGRTVVLDFADAQHGLSSSDEVVVTIKKKKAVK